MPENEDIVSKSILKLIQERHQIDESFIPAMLGDVDMNAIYKIVHQFPVNTKAIMQHTNIPRTTLHRKLYEMIIHGMIRGVKENKNDNIQVIFFPQIHKIKISWNRGVIAMKVSPMEEKEHLVLKK